jgi:hypothetical protein
MYVIDQKAPKTLALTLLGLISLVGPFVEMVTTGGRGLEQFDSRSPSSDPAHLLVVPRRQARARVGAGLL